MNKLMYCVLIIFWPITESFDYDVYSSVKKLYAYSRNNLLLLSVYLLVNMSVPSTAVYTMHGIGKITFITIFTLPIAVIIGVGIGSCIPAAIFKLEELYFLNK